MSSHIATKYADIDKKDKAPIGTIVRVVVEKDKKEDETLYIQVSPNNNEPEWIFVNSFIGTVFGDLIEHKEFVDECLRIYHNKKNNPLFNIVKIMSSIAQI